MTGPLIMLVDDEVSFVETMAKRLAKRKIDTITAFSAEDGLEKLKTNQDIDVIVLDIKMPGMDGIEALKEINKKGTTILLVEQNALLALETAHTGYVLEKGTIVLHGKGSTLLSEREVRKIYLGEN